MSCNSTLSANLEFDLVFTIYHDKFKNQKILFDDIPDVTLNMSLVYFEFLDLLEKVFLYILMKCEIQQ